MAHVARGKGRGRHRRLRRHRPRDGARARRRGADVGLIARGEDRLASAAAEVRRAGRRACVAPADVADAEAVEAAAARIEAELGPIDVWVNVAMAAVLAEPWDARRRSSGG